MVTYPASPHRSSLTVMPITPLLVLQRGDFFIAKAIYLGFKVGILGFVPDGKDISSKY